MAKRDGLSVNKIKAIKKQGKYGDGRNLYLNVGPRRLLRV